MAIVLQETRPAQLIAAAKGTSAHETTHCPLVTLVASQDDFVAAMKRRRSELRLSLLDVDYRAGFQDGYTAHLETPHARSGRNSLKINPMTTLWLDVLGLTLAIIPKANINAQSEQVVR